MAKILVVEDDDMLADLMDQTLSLADHHVALARNGVEALAAVASDPPEVILMDIGMPLMDGYEAMRRLKAEARWQTIPIIALTAHASANDRQQALAAGADDYEPKPVDFARLEAKIAVLCSGRTS